MTHHARVVIIGGGIYGCGLLYHLVENGWRDVVLLEKNELAAGSTWHAAGFCTHYSFNLTHVRIRKHSAELYQHLERTLDEPTGFHACGGIRTTADPDRLDEFRHGLSVGRQLGIDFQMLTAGEIAEICPLLEVNGLAGALYEPLDGYVDPSQATQAMARQARAGGATVHRQRPVTGIEPTATGEWRIETEAGDFLAEHVVIAAGFWSRALGDMVGLDLPIVPLLHQYLVTEDIAAVARLDESRVPLVRHHDEQWYVRRERDGLILGAYEKRPRTWSLDGVPPEFGMELLPGDIERIEPIVLRAIERMPVLGEAGIKTVVHGPVSYTPDGQPLVGPAAGLRNAWLAAGSGFGIGEGAGVGRILAEWLSEGAPPYDMLAFDPRRFGSHVDRDYRVEKSVEVFSMQFATHYPFEERPAARPRKISPVHARLASRGARFGARYGWERPNWFARAGESHDLTFRRAGWFDAVAEECRGLGRGVGLMDLTGFSQYRIGGQQAAAYLDSLSANRLPVAGGIRLSHFLNTAGGIECEFTICHLGEDEWHLVCAAAAERHHLDWLRSHLPASVDVEIENLSESRGVLAVAGPRSRELLQSLTDEDLSNPAFPWLTARRVTIAGVEVDAWRVSYTGESGWELHLRMEDQLALYEAISARGEPLGLTLVGFYAIDAMRLEKAHRAWGHELTVEITPLEAGLERFVCLRDREFIGRDALLRRRVEGVRQRVVSLLIESEESDPFGGEAVFQGERVVGAVTSGGYGHRIDSSIALALVDVSCAGVDARLEVEILDRLCPARVVREPAYDPANARLRG